MVGSPFTKLVSIGVLRNKNVYYLKIPKIYYMAEPVLGKSLCSDWFFLSQDFAVRTVSMETVQPVSFVLERSLQI